MPSTAVKPSWQRGLPYDLSGTVAGDIVDSALYNNLGQITDIDFHNGVTTEYSYWDVGGAHDSNFTGESYGRLGQIKTSKSSVYQWVYYEWDEAGNLERQYDWLDTGWINYSYDSLNRLTGVSGKYSHSYSYDEIGNIVSFNGTSYSYGTRPHAVTSADSTSYSYDNNGNMVSRGGTTITWDVENRPTAVGSSATFVYDGDGNRVKKEEGGETVIYVNQYYEKNLDTGTITTYYYLGGKLVALRKGYTLRYIHQDHLTGTAMQTTSSGSKGATMTYYPYGSTRSSSGSLDTDKEFTGQRHDGTGLYYYNARYYDPTLGRFTSPDTFVQTSNVFGIFAPALTVNISATLGTMPNLGSPVKGKGSTSYPQTLNRYSYALNNPLRHVDPSGWDVRITEMNVSTWGLTIFGGTSYDIWFEDDYGEVARITGSGWGFRTPTVLSVTSTEVWYPKTVEGIETVLDLQPWDSEWGYSVGRYGAYIGNTYTDGERTASGGLSADLGLPAEAHRFWTSTSVEIISQPRIGPLSLNLVETPVMASQSGVFWVRYDGEWLMCDVNDPLGSNLSMQQIAQLQIVERDN